MTPQEEKIRELGELASLTIDSMSKFISKYSNDSDLRSLINDLGYAIYQINQWFDYLKFQDAYFTLRNKELEDMNKAIDLQNFSNDQNIADDISEIIDKGLVISREELDELNSIKNAAIIGNNWSIDDE